MENLGSSGNKEKATKMVNIWINIKDFFFSPEDFKIGIPVESKNYNIV